MDDLDERVYCVVNLSDSCKVEAVGVRLANGSDYLVGSYLFWDKFENPRPILEEMIGLFGEVRLYAPPGSSRPGLVCKMSFAEPALCLLSGNTKDYKSLKLDLLELRATNPRVFLHLDYDSEKKLWNYKPVLTDPTGISNYNGLP